jgi:hypothetical protein
MCGSGQDKASPIKLLFVPFVLFTIGIGGALRAAPAAKTLDLCTLAISIHTYAGDEVRVKAFFAAGFESAVLYDPGCQDGKPMVWVEFKPKVEGEMRPLRHILNKKHVALVTVQGMVRGGEPINIDWNLPIWLKERFKGSTQMYGHLNSFAIMIEIDKILEAKDAGDLPPPHASEAPAISHR